MIGRDLSQERAFFGIVRVSILADPGCAGEQFVVAQHVEQRHLYDDCVPEFGTLGELNAHQQAAVRAALDAKAAWRCDLARDQIFGDGGEVVVDDLALRLQAGLVPGGAELAAATDVGQHIGAAALDPELTDGRRIARRHRELEAAIRVQQRRVRAVQFHALRAHDEIGNLRAVFRRRFELIYRHVRSVEARRQRLHFLEAARRGVAEIEAVRLQEARDVDERFVVLIAGRNHADRGVRRQGQLRARPGAVREGVGIERAFDVLIERDEQTVARARHLLDRLARAGHIDDDRLCGRRIALQRGEIEGEQRALA